jgi:hypothetical protein
MQHRSIAKKEGQGFGLIALGKIYIELRCGIHDSLLNGRIDAGASI